MNTTRVETLDRFYNRKLNRVQLSTSPSWAPHRKSKREVHSSYETFDGCMDEKPQKELRKVFTEKVLAGDREAIRQIAKRVQNEETWKEVFKRMEQERAVLGPCRGGGTSRGSLSEGASGYESDVGSAPKRVTQA